MRRRSNIVVGRARGTMIVAGMLSATSGCGLVAGIEPLSGDGLPGRNPGELFWAERLGSTQNDWPVGVQAIPDGTSLVVGRFSNTLELPGCEPLEGAPSNGPPTGTFRARFESGGLCLTADQLTDTELRFPTKAGFKDAASYVPVDALRVTAMAADEEEHIFIAGLVEDAAVDLGCGAEVPAGSPFVAKFDGGNCLWSRALPGVLDMSSILVDKTGDLIVTGGFNDVLLEDGPFCPEEPEPTQEDVLLAKLGGANGACAWRHAFGGPANEWGQRLALDEASGRFVLTGSMSGSPTSFFVGTDGVSSKGESDQFVAMFDDEKAVWAAGGFFDYFGTFDAVIFDADGRVMLGGAFEGKAHFGAREVSAKNVRQDAMLWELDADGAPIWMRDFGGGGFDRVHALALDPEGDVFVAGSFEGTIDLGTGPLVSAGGLDIFLTKVQP